MRGTPSLVLLAACVITLTGCSVVAPASDPSVSAPIASPTSGSDVEPDDEAQAALAEFDSATAALVGGDELPLGSRVVESLVAAGFDPDAIEISPDRTAVGLEREAIEFSARVGDSCLVGQIGTWGYSSAIVEPIATGTCLIGNTASDG